MLTARNPLAVRLATGRPRLPQLRTQHAIRAFALACYLLAALVAFAIVAPVLPAAYRAAAYEVRTVVPGLAAPASATEHVLGERLETRAFRVERTQSVALVALDAGTTPFALYALNPGKLPGPFVEGDTRLRVPR